jgi:hypothetical protein
MSIQDKKRRQISRATAARCGRMANTVHAATPTTAIITAAERAPERKASDKRLRDCVWAKGHNYISPLMYFGVSIGGVSWLPTPFRWGFGQKKPKKTD